MRTNKRKVGRDMIILRKRSSWGMKIKNCISGRERLGGWKWFPEEWQTDPYEKSTELLEILLRSQPTHADDVSLPNHYYETVKIVLMKLGSLS